MLIVYHLMLKLYDGINTIFRRLDEVLQYCFMTDSSFVEIYILLFLNYIIYCILQVVKTILTWSLLLILRLFTNISTILSLCVYLKNLDKFNSYATEIPLCYL